MDIETTPVLGYTWGVWEQNVIEILEDWYILSFAYRWAEEKTVTVKALPDYRGYRKNKKCDLSLVKDLHELLSSCDIAIAHNGDAFDLKKANARFIYHKLKPPPPYRSIDTLKILRKHFKFDSNKLDAACAFLGIGRKLQHTGKHLWLGCMRGDQEAWAKMRRYNAHDVILLFALYDYIKGWAGNLPDLNLYSSWAPGVLSGRCPTCGHSNLKEDGFIFKRSTVYRRYRCKDCGSWHAGERITTNRRNRQHS